MARKTGSHSGTTGPLIYDAALRLFARHGYAAVSMRQIAAEVGVQAGALYLYTPDKQTLLFDLMKTHMEELQKAWDEACPQADAATQLEAFTRFHIRYHMTRPDAIFIAYMELRNLDAANFAVIEGLRKKYEMTLEEILRRGQEAGQFTFPDAKVATNAIIAMLNGIPTWYKEGGRLDRDRVERIYWNMIRKSVAA